jgi:hypothetical protein
MDRSSGPRQRLFRKEVYQTPIFTRAVEALGMETADLIVEVTATHYPLFRRRKHGLVVGQLSKDLPPGYEGPGLEFIYKVLANKVCFLCLQAGGFNEKELAALEDAHDL